MTRSPAQLSTLVLAAALSGCAPPELSAPEEKVVGRCLELAYKQETSAECAQVTKAMEKAFFDKHPDFYERLLAERKKFVEERIAEDQQRRDDLNLCLEEREAGTTSPPVCEKFMAHEITRELENRRRTRCAEAWLDGKAVAPQLCEGLSESEIKDEVQMERLRRERLR